MAGRVLPDAAAPRFAEGKALCLRQSNQRSSSCESGSIDLATRLILDGAGQELAAALVELSGQAAGRGYPDAARIASALAERMGAATADAAGGEGSLSDEIARLREALEAARDRPPEPWPAGPAPPQGNSLAQDPELVGDFILESRDHLASIENRMLILERSPGDTEAIHSVFRGFHTIKGLAGFLEFPEIQEVAHEVETLLDLARNSRLAITPPLVDVVLASADYLKHAVACVEAAAAGRTADPPENRPALLSRIRAAMAGEDAPAAPPPETPAPPAAAAADPAAPSTAKTEDPPPAKAADAFSVRIDTGKLDYLMDMVGEMVIAQSLIAGAAGADIRPLSAHEFEQIRRLAYGQLGLDLHNGKEQLVATRLGKKFGN